MASYSPPPPAGPARAPGSHGFNAAEAISYGWKKFGENSGPMLLVTLLLFLVAIPGNYAARALTDTNLNFSVAGAISTIITGVLALVIGAVMARGALDITEGYPFDIVLAFKMLVLLSLAVIVVGLLALCVGALVALPVLAIVWAYSYRVFSRKLVAP